MMKSRVYQAWSVVVSVEDDLAVDVYVFESKAEAMEEALLGPSWLVKGEQIGGEPLGTIYGSKSKSFVRFVEGPDSEG